MSEQVANIAVPQDQGLLTESEKQQLASWNDTAQAYPLDAALPQLVAAQAMAAPDALAVVAADGTLTYGELEASASRLAHHLLSLGAGPETLVALHLKCSAALVIAALGVLKTGAAYLPLDPSNPPERLAAHLKNSQARVVVTHSGLACQLPAGSWRVVDLTAEAAQIAGYPAEPPAVDWEIGNLAYVIYTSGSTGRPKGVEITHESLLNLVFWHQRSFAVGVRDRATLLASPGFDASVWEMWPYISAGASLHIPDSAIRSDAKALRDWLVAQQITVTFLSTAMAEQVMALDWPANTALRVLLTGADTLHYYPSRALPFTLVNNYGPTECTVVASSGVVPPSEQAEDRPTIGRPIANTQMYVLDEYLRQVPVGSTGELHIGGKGLARGYRDQSETTADRFIVNPFSSLPGSRLYKTGDLARYLPDGQISFMGRIDDQIKIRGHRIEPNEIVTVLDRHPAVQASCVVTREDLPGEKRLVAYVVPAAGSQPTCRGLQDFLRASVPHYAVPAVFVLLDSLPLTSNGKVDRAGLPAPDAGNILRDASSVPPRTLVEERVAGILASLLQVQQVGAHDNFFFLGGHSLLGTQVIGRVRDSFGLDLPLRTLFEAPTVAELSTEIERRLLLKLQAMTEEEAQNKLSSIASV